MASRTIQTGADADAALNFLGRQKNPQIDGETYFQQKIQDVINAALTEADDKRFNLVTELMKSSDKGKAISNLRDLLGV